MKERARLCGRDDVCIVFRVLWKANRSVALREGQRVGLGKEESGRRTRGVQSRRGEHQVEVVFSILNGPTLSAKIPV